MMATKKAIKPVRSRRTVMTLDTDVVRSIVREMLDSSHSIRSEQLETVVNRSATRAVRETLVQVGIDTADPIKAQATFVALRELVTLFADEEFQADLAHLRSWRRTMDGARSKSLGVIIATMITGIVILIVAGFKGWLTPAK